MITPAMMRRFSREIGGGFYGKPFDFSDHLLTTARAGELPYPGKAVWALQAHGKRIAVCETPGRREKVDVLITKKTGLPLLIKNADCLAILFFDSKQRAVAAVHAGWRGLAHRIITHAVKRMEKEFGSVPEDLWAALSPGIHFPRFSDPFRETPGFFHRFIKDGCFIDLWSIAREELLENGVPAKHVEMPSFCTYCMSEGNFWSHRRGETGRNAGIIFLRS